MLMKSSTPWRTMHNVRIDATLASIGFRMLAYGLDLLFKGFYAVAIFAIVFEVLKIDSEAVLLVLLLPVIFYTLLFESLNDGQTPGKSICNIKVTHVSGAPAGLQGSFLRWIFRIIDFSLLSPAVALISAAASNKRQRIGDLTADTIVISTRMRQRSVLKSYTSLKDNYEPVYLQAKQLSREEIVLIRRVLGRPISARREELISSLVENLSTKYHIDLVEPPKRFLFSLVKDYNYFQLKNQE